MKQVCENTKTQCYTIPFNVVVFDILASPIIEQSTCPWKNVKDSTRKRKKQHSDFQACITAVLYPHCQFQAAREAPILKPGLAPDKSPGVNQVRYTHVQYTHVDTGLHHALWHDDAGPNWIVQKQSTKRDIKFNTCSTFAPVSKGGGAEQSPCLISTSMRDSKKHEHEIV